MQKNYKYSLIQIDDMTIEEKIGNIFVTIKPGAYCTFNKLVPSNARHYHRCYELCIVTDGYGIFNYDGKKIPVKKGDIFISDPDVLHEITIVPESLNTDNELELFHFSINLQKSDTSSKATKQELIISQFMKKHAVIRRSQHQLFAYLNFLFSFTRSRETANNKAAATFALENAIKGIVYSSLIILTEQLKVPKTRKVASSNIIDNALQYIGTHLSEKITLDELSAYCNTSRRNLQLLFHQYLESTIIDYINNRRMVLASSYLRMNFRVCDVGPNIGIEDPAQFCRIFKKYYGISPKKYQMEYKTNGMIFGADYK